MTNSKMKDSSQSSKIQKFNIEAGAVLLLTGRGGLSTPGIGGGVGVRALMIGGWGGQGAGGR